MNSYTKLIGGFLLQKKAMKANTKAMKYGLPLAGVGALGAGGYMMHKKVRKGFHCGGSSSGSGSGSSEEEEEE